MDSTSWRPRRNSSRPKVSSPRILSCRAAHGALHRAVHAVGFHGGITSGSVAGLLLGRNDKIARVFAPAWLYAAMSGPSDRVHFYRNLLPIAVDEGFLGRRATLAARMPLLDRSRSNKANEERPPCGDWPRQNGADRSSALTKN